MSSTPDNAAFSGVPWDSAAPEALQAYASSYEDMETDLQPDELDWFFVEAFPVAALGYKDY